jgi:cytochrome c-type biogenesis protein CcmH/NrfG
MDRDPLGIIAELSRLTAETQQILAQGQLRMEATQRLGLRLQAFAITLLGLSLLGTGLLVWKALATRHDHAAQTQALQAATQTLTAQTEALREVLRQSQSRP